MKNEIQIFTQRLKAEINFKKRIIDFAECWNKMESKT